MRNSDRGLGVLLLLAAASYFGIWVEVSQAQTTVYRVPRSETYERSAGAPDGGPAPADDKKPKQCAPDQTGQNLVCSQGPDALKGLHWGIGLLYGSNLGGVGSVTLVPSGASKIVQVTRENNAAARAAFELHYFVPATKAYAVQWAWGPFVSLNSKPLADFGSGASLSSIGAGLMIGANAFVDDASAKSVSHSVNLGIGWMVDTGVKELAAGVVDGQPTTLTQDQLTRTTTKSGFMAILSYNFTLN
jgi:hypothetical protein